MSEPTIKNKKYYRIYKNLRFARRSFFFLLVFTMFISLVFFRDEITVENIKYFMKYIDIQSPEFVNADKTIEFSPDSTDKSTGFIMLRGNVGVISGRNFELYDFNGRRVQSSVLPSAKSLLTAGKKYALAYDTDGKEIAIYNSFSNVLSKTYDYSVTGAHILDNGEFAVITSEKNYTSGIIAYDKDFDEIFRWMSRDRYITAVFLTDSAKKVIAADTYMKNGVFESEIICFDTGNGQELFKTSFDDELPMKLFCSGRRIALLTDKSLKFFNNSGELISSVPLSSGTLNGFYPYGDCIILSKQTKVLGNVSSVEIYNFNGDVVYENSYQDEVLDLSYKDGTLYVLERGKLSITDDVLKTRAQRDTEEIETDIIYTGVFASDNGEYVLVSSSGASKFKV